MYPPSDTRIVFIDTNGIIIEEISSYNTPETIALIARELEYLHGPVTPHHAQLVVGEKYGVEKDTDPLPTCHQYGFCVTDSSTEGIMRCSICPRRP